MDQIKNRKINVLDHGFVRLVDWMGSDLSVVRNARVSYDAAWRAGEDKGSDAKLINYLYNNGHNTPFESVSFTFEVRAPIFVFRQWHRHRTWAFNEVSARYKELPEEFYIPKPHLIGKQNPDNKQMRNIMSVEEYEALDRDSKLEIENIRNIMRNTNQQAFERYRKMIEQKVPRELARAILPVAAYSHMFGTVNLHNAMRFLKERLHPHAQYEIRVFALAMLELMHLVAPVTMTAFVTGLDELYEEVQEVWGRISGT